MASAVREISNRFLLGLLVVAIVLGIGFRFFELERKLYWHDEVYTSMRAAGFTRDEIDRELFQNRIIPAAQLQKYQKLKPGSTYADTIRSLAVEDPQHPPFYFLMARQWMQWFGSSLAASRFLPALLSLLALPLMYGLAWELFDSDSNSHDRRHSIALLATALLALSPFDILFAQTARQYSLLAVTVIGSSFLLLRALRLQTCRSWGLYAGAVALGLYTHPFFGLTPIAHIPFLIGHCWRVRAIAKQTAVRFSLAIAIALSCYSPWLAVLAKNYQRLSATTDWNRVSVDFSYLVKLWVLSFTALFIDLDFGFDNPATFLLRLPYVICIAVALYVVCRKTTTSTWLFVLTSIFVPFIMLAIPDLLFGGKRSAVSRYLISCFPGVQLAVAYLIADWQQIKFHQLWRGGLAILLTGSVVSCTVSAFSNTWWNKDLSYFNNEVASLLPTTPAPLVLSDIGDDYTNTGDLISLSYMLPESIQLLLLSQPPDLKVLQDYQSDRIFLFRPSQKLKRAIEQALGQIERVQPSQQLWRLRRSSGVNHSWKKLVLYFTRS